nr:reverse transcriptase domain-containing protein [Tanacetum cinerariifolium]
MNTRFSSMLDIDPVKISTSYEVELADGKVVSTNTVLKGCVLNLLNHVFEINLIPIELGTFDVIIGIDWLVKHDAVIVYGKKVVRIPYENKTLIVESDKESVDAAIAAERARQANVKNNAGGAGIGRGQDTAPAVCKCIFARFMKCNPISFHGTEGDVKLQRWFEKTKSVFYISESAEGKKTMNQMPWTKMKQLMTAEFCPVEEIQRMEHELWNLKVKKYNIVAYTQRFNKLALMCPRMVKPKSVKIDAYIRGLSNNIKGEVIVLGLPI